MGGINPSIPTLATGLKEVLLQRVNTADTGCVCCIGQPNLATSAMFRSRRQLCLLRTVYARCAVLDNRPKLCQLCCTVGSNCARCVPQQAQPVRAVLHKNVQGLPAVIHNRHSMVCCGAQPTQFAAAVEHTEVNLCLICSATDTAWVCCVTHCSQRASAVEHSRRNWSAVGHSSIPCVAPTAAATTAASETCFGGSEG